MYRRDKQDQEATEKLSGKQQRPTAEDQENSSMRTHDQVESNLKPLRFATTDPSTSHEFQVAHDEHGGMRQKEHPSSSLADAGSRLKDSTPTAPSPLAAQGNTRERESNSRAGDSFTSLKPNADALDEPSTTVSQPREIAAPIPIHPVHAESESAQNTSSDSPHFPTSYPQEPSPKALFTTSQDIVPAPTLKSGTPRSSNSTPKKRTTWYDMGVRDNDAPLGLKKTRPLSLGFGYKDRKKAALAAAHASARSPVMANSPTLSSAAGPLSIPSSSPNPESVQPLRPKATSNLAALRSQSFSPSQDRPVHIQETMHAPAHHTKAATTGVTVVPKTAAASAVPSSSPPGSFKERFASSPKFSKAFKNMPANMRRSHVPTGPVVMKALPAPAEKLPGAFPDSPVVAPVETPTVAPVVTPSVVPVYSTPVGSSEDLPTFARPVQSTTATTHVHDSKAVVPAYSTPVLSHSDLPTTLTVSSAASHPTAKESAPASKSTIATAAAAIASAAAGVLHKLSDHPEPPVVTPDMKETVANATVPAAKVVTLPTKPSTAAALKTPKKDLSLYEEEESTYPRGDESTKFENPARPAVVEDVIEVKELPKEYHSTAVGLKMPKKNLFLYDEEEGTYPRGDEAVKIENPAHPAVVEDIVEVKKFPKEALAALAAPAAMATTLPEQHSTAAALKLPKKNLSLYDEEESTYPRGDEAAHHENPAHPPVVKEIVEVTAVPVVDETKELPATPMDGARRGSQSSVKEKVKGAFSGFHMPKMVRKKDDKEVEAGTTPTTTTTIPEVKPAMAAAAAAPIAASIAAALRDTHDDEPFIEPPHHRLTSAPAVFTEPLYYKPVAPLIDEEKSTPISARKLEPVSVLPPTGSVMVMDKATTTEPAHLSHEVTSHPHVAVVAPVTGAAATAVPNTTATTTTVKKETSERGTSTHHPTTAKVDPTSHATTAVPYTTAAPPHATTTTSHASTSPSTKAAHMAAAVAAPFVAAKEKLTGHHHGDKTTHAATPITTTTAAPGSGVHPSRGESVDMPKEQLAIEKKVIGKAPEDVASKIHHNDDEEVIMVETITTKTTITVPPTRTHVYESGGAAAAAPVAHAEKPIEVAHTGVKTTATHTVKPSEVKSAGVKPIDVKAVETHVDRPIETKHVEVAKPVEGTHTDVKHEPSATKSVVAAVTGAASTVAAVFSGRRHSTIGNAEKVPEVVPATTSRKSEDAVMMKTTPTTTTTDVEPSHVSTTAAADTHVIKPVIDTRVTKVAETDAAAVPITAAAVDATIHPVDKDHTKAVTVTTEETVVAKIPETDASIIPHKDDVDALMVETTTTTTEVTPPADAKGKGKHDDHLPADVAAIPVAAAETAPKPAVEVPVTETKEAKKERKKKEKLAKKEANKNKVPLKTKLNKFTGAGISAAAAAAVRYKDNQPMRPTPALKVTEEDVKKPSVPVVAAPLLTMTEDDVEKPEIPEVPEPIFTVTEDDVEVPYPVLTKHPVLTVTEDDVEYPSPLSAPHPVIPHVAPKAVSTSALKVASAPRPMIPAQPVQGKDIKLPKIKGPKVPKLKKKSKVSTTTAAVVPEIETHVVEPVKPVVETVTTRVVEPVVVPKPKPAVVEPPKIAEAPKPIDVPKVEEAPKVVEIPKPVIEESPSKPVIAEAPKPKPVVIENPKPLEVPKPVIVESVPKKVVEETPKPVVIEPPPKPVVVEAPPKPVAVAASVPKPDPVPAAAAASAPTPAPAPAVVPTISTNVETVIPAGYSGTVPKIGADESLVWVKKVYTTNDYYDSEDEDELDEFGYRKDRDVSRYIAPTNESSVQGGRSTVDAGARQPVDYTSKNHTNTGIVNSAQPQQRTMVGGYYTQPRQSAI
ncbi:hypothetical protein BG015_009671 [Linnemannia schmuckeri]|uniref:Uncharacterized protein n=1 Tax=Linnemannia schmuckeri TaxID=64567 RepID=A0A9P5RV44_9FUNG|nr:hypothetical protein BG015_009671 [Linnemannia schmuckeri]